MDTISDRISGGTHGGLAVTPTGSIEATTAVHEEQTSIHSRIP
jgi:hypothetical protein